MKSINQRVEGRCLNNFPNMPPPNNSSSPGCRGEREAADKGRSALCLTFLQRWEFQFNAPGRNTGRKKGDDSLLKSTCLCKGKEKNLEGHRSRCYNDYLAWLGSGTDREEGLR